MDLTSTKDKWMPKIKSYLSTINWKNAILFIAFLLLAFTFWLMLFFQREKVESSYKIPLKFTNIPNDIVFNETLPNEIEIRVSDRGSEIFSYDFLLEDSLEINVEKYKKDKVTNLQGAELVQLIMNHLSKSAELKAYYPINISLATSKLQKKELTVVFDGEITTSRSNLVAEEPTFLPKAVIAYGSGSQLAELTSAPTVHAVYGNLKATSQLKVKLNPVSGVKFVPDEVEIYIPVNEYTERTFEIPITVKHVPSKVDVKFFPSQAEVSFSVTLEEYKKISPEDFEIELDYIKFHENTNGRVELELTKSPTSIRKPRISPSSVEFLLEDR